MCNNDSTNNNSITHEVFTILAEEYLAVQTPHTENEVHLIVEVV